MAEAICSIPDCEKPAERRGMCRTCYSREWYRLRNGYYERYSDDPCSVDGCSEPRRSAGKPYCEAHYYRLRRTGDVGADAPIAKHRHGPRACTAPDCDQVIPKGNWCSKHEARIARHGDPTVVKKATPNPTYGPDNPVWLGDAITSYSAQHSRLRSRRGPASAFACVDCGGVAEQWSYDHGCPDERIDGKTGCPWCPHLDCYSPRDAVCHSAFDRRARRSA